MKKRTNNYIKYCIKAVINQLIDEYLEFKINQKKQRR